MAEKEKSKLEKYLAGFTRVQILIIVAFAVYLIFLAKATTPIPNYNNETNTVLYTVDSMVPKTYVNPSNLFFGFLLLAGLVLSFVGKEVKESQRISIDEAKDIMNNHLDNVGVIKTKSGGLIQLGDYNIDNNFILKSVVNKGEKKTEDYVLQINITSPDGVPLYVKGYVHSYTRFINGFIEMDAPLEEKDKCSNCGEEFDTKYVDTEDLKQYKKIKEGLKD